MEWIDSLQGLPVPVAILVVFAVCLIFVLRAIFRRVVDPLVASHRETAGTIKEALDTNTDAVKESVKHNETIIENHLSRTGKRDAEILAEMKGAVAAIDQMNHRRRTEG